MMRLELRNLIVGPAMVAIRLDRPQLDGSRRIGAQPAALDRKVARRPQGSEPAAGGMRWLAVQQCLYPLGRQLRHRPVAIGGAESLKDTASHALSASALAAKVLLRVKVLGDHGGHAAGLAAAGADSGTWT